jgi:ribosome-associated heat shock protein Hsp15
VISGEAPARLRVDKWLWHARLYKTRSLAARAVQDGHVRLDGARLSKPSTTVGPGHVLTVAMRSGVRVIEIAALGTRRGPAPEAQALYLDRTPAGVRPPPRIGPRPTGRDRRRLDADRAQGREAD